MFDKKLIPLIRKQKIERLIYNNQKEQEIINNGGKMMKTNYIINKKWEGNDGEQITFDGIIEIDDIVIESVDEEWRSVFYNLTNPQEIAEHIAYNIIVNNATLTRLDGFADLNDDYVRILK